MEPSGVPTMHEDSEPCLARACNGQDIAAKPLIWILFRIIHDFVTAGLPHVRSLEVVGCQEGI